MFIFKVLSLNYLSLKFSEDELSIVQKVLSRLNCFYWHFELLKLLKMNLHAQF